MMRPTQLTAVSPTLAQTPGNEFSCMAPWEWSRQDVGEWLLNCEREYSLDKIDLKRFAMNGKALYILTKEDFIDRLPSIGDVLYNHLHIVREEACRTFVYGHGSPHRFYDSTSQYDYLQNIGQAHVSPISPINARVPEVSHGSFAPTSPPVPTFPKLLSGPCERMRDLQNDEGPHNLVVYGRRDDSPYIDSHSASSPNSSDAGIIPQDFQEPRNEDTIDRKENKGTTDKMEYTPVIFEEKVSGSKCSKKGNNKDGRLLWDFLSNLLKSNSAPQCISWEDQENDTFRIHDATALAVLWGRQKNRSNMTYEKMSRALRYYYKMNIIQKVKGKRLTYKFMKKPEEIRRNRGLALRSRAQRQTRSQGSFFCDKPDQDQSNTPNSEGSLSSVQPLVSTDDANYGSPALALCQHEHSVRPEVVDLKPTSRLSDSTGIVFRDEDMETDRSWQTHGRSPLDLSEAPGGRSPKVLQPCTHCSHGKCEAHDGYSAQKCEPGHFGPAIKSESYGGYSPRIIHGVNLQEHVQDR